MVVSGIEPDTTIFQISIRKRGYNITIPVVKASAKCPS